ncbi:MAG: Uncharacterised protein [Flavobacteriaceae bacterium]|nr:MAG: Uncharacterised protein [Flavobacteriaceae bacterium]
METNASVTGGKSLSKNGAVFESLTTALDVPFFSTFTLASMTSFGWLFCRFISITSSQALRSSVTRNKRIYFFIA